MAQKGDLDVAFEQQMQSRGRHGDLTKHYHLIDFNEFILLDPAGNEVTRGYKQAFCLEEMFGVEVPEGAVYSHQSRRRREVAFDAELREETERVIGAIREMQASGELPAPVNDGRCPRCPLR